MSLHIAVAGFTSSQRLLFVAKKSGSQRKEVRELEQQAHIFGPLVNTVTVFMCIYLILNLSNVAVFLFKILNICIMFFYLRYKIFISCFFV